MDCGLWTSPPVTPGFKKVALLLLAALLLVGVSFVQQSLNQDREELGLTRIQPLENAPPVLAFTTVALGGFRGLISNVLWIRANDLQEEDKFFEMAQLADWITKLEPHFVQVWLVQAWNMAYNISVKFKDFSDRWRWVERGIELLRDDGLRYNPNETLIYRELGWFFQHKMGQNLDDANMYYKRQWADEMTGVFGDTCPVNFDTLIHPQTADQTNRVRLLVEKYKMDPDLVKEIDQRYGPLEWRLPEAHAIYWAVLGLKKAQENPTKINSDDLITLRRLVYQSMQLSFHQGRLVPNPFSKVPDLGPNLDIIPKVSAAYEQAAVDDEKNRDHILKAHRNFLRDAVYFLYIDNRLTEAAFWYKYLGTNYPDQTLLDFDANSYPRNLTLSDYAVERVQEDVTESMDQKRVKAILAGLIAQAYTSMALGQEQRAAGFKRLADLVLASYQDKTKARAESLSVAPIEEIKRDVLNRMLDTQHGLPPAMRAVLRTKLDLGPETAPPPPSPPATNSSSEKSR
ncbi:MAG TPA: hypothetical protein VN578_03170 [Candidatus Binatia bacterium]|nr:hypothetical protein [Candidatus Binatia bacterium]